MRGIYYITKNATCTLELLPTPWLEFYIRKSAPAVLLVELSRVFLLPTKRKFTVGGGGQS